MLAPLPATKSNLPSYPVSAPFPWRSTAAPSELSKVSSLPAVIRSLPDVPLIPKTAEYCELELGKKKNFWK